MERWLWKIEWKLLSLYRRIDQSMPYRGACGHWKPKKDLVYMEHRTAGWVLVCPDCKQKEESWDGTGSAR